MASNPVEPRPQYFAGIPIYGKTKFVENLKCKYGLSNSCKPTFIYKSDFFLNVDNKK